MDTNCENAPALAAEYKVAVWGEFNRWHESDDEHK